MTLSAHSRVRLRGDLPDPLPAAQPLHWPIRVALVGPLRALTRESRAGLLRFGLEVVSYPDASTALLRAAEDHPHVFIVPASVADFDLLLLVDLLRQWSPAPVYVSVAADTEASWELASQACAHGATGLLPAPLPAIALARRVQQQDTEARAASVVSCSDLVMDADQHVATLHGHELTLTVREFRGLWHLVEQSPRLVSAEEFAAATESASSGHAAVQGAIARIRQRLSAVDADAAAMVETVRSLGYRVRPVQHQAESH